MHSLSEFGANVPAFLAKLWKLVDDPETNELISWSEEGTSFYIRDQAQFSRKLLPMYYKHNNMASFIRQLNMYGFHKIVSTDAGSLRLDKDEMEFAHQCFIRGHPYLLEHIKRKVGKSQLLTNKQIEEGKEVSNGRVVVKAEFMNNVLAEVKSMRGRQESVENRLSAMKQENEALWRELSLLRQKHIKQQTIVNKLIQFLVTLVQPSQRLKRRYPLMLGNVPHPNGKSNGKIHNLNQSDIMDRSPTGTIIHELDPDSILQDDTMPPDSDTLSNTITLHVPGTELAEVINSSLEPEILSPDTEVLDNLDPSIIQNSLNVSLSPVPLLEVNPELVDGTEEALKASSPSPELLLSVPPNELNPAIVVPALRTSKTRSTNVPTPQIAAQKMQTRSTSQGTGSAQYMVTRRNAENAMKGTTLSNKSMSVQYKGVSTQDFKRESVDSQPAIKKELRVLPPRNRKKKQINNKETSFQNHSNAVNNLEATDELLAEVGLTNPLSPNLGLSTSGIVNSDNMNGSMCGSVTSPAPSQLLAYPESPVPIIHSPVSSPSSHCSMVQHIPMSPGQSPTITDVTSPLMIQPSTSSSVCEQQSPQQSPSGPLPSSYDMTLACTSQAGASPGNTTTTIKSSPFNRCEINRKEDLDYHVGSVDTELGQLKDILNNGVIQLDANTLLGLFSGDDLSIPDLSGNELMHYQPDFMDLEEIWNNDQNRSTPPPSPIDNLSSGLNTPVMMPTSPGFPGPAAKRRRN